MEHEEIKYSLIIFNPRFRRRHKNIGFWFSYPIRYPRRFILILETLQINESALNISGKYPQLTEKPLTFNIQHDGDIYIGEVHYNSYAGELFLKIIDKEGNVIQGETLYTPNTDLLSNFIFGTSTLKGENNALVYA